MYRMINSVYKMDIKELEIIQVILSLRVLISLPITFFSICVTR